MRRESLFATRVCAVALACLVMGGSIQSPATAQDTFRNPALEDEDEKQRAVNDARALIGRERYADAIKLLRRALSEQGSDCAECHYYIGVSFFRSGNAREAANAFREALASDHPNKAEVHNYLGVSLFQQNKKKLLDEAVAAFRTAIELSNDTIPLVHFNLAYALIRQGSEEEGVRAFERFLEMAPDHPSAGQARALIQNPRRLDVRVAPGFRVVATDGEELSNESLAGKIVLLDFWATWCGPCRQEMPGLKLLWSKHGGEDFIIIGVSLDNTERTLSRYVAREKIGWPQVFEGPGSKRTLSAMYSVRAIPLTVLIDHNGVIRGQRLRGRALSNRVDDLVRELRRERARESE